MKPPPRPEPDESPVAEALKLVKLLAEATAQGLAADEQSLEDADSDFALKEAISEATLSLRLRTAVERAASKSNDSMAALRIAVCAFTIALRNDGITPEEVLIRLKVAIRAETLSPLWTTSSWSGPRLRETITTWCIQDYFGSEDCAN